MAMDRKKPVELLEVIAFRAGCLYISDIPSASLARLAKAVRTIVYEDFPASEWEAAACYFADSGLFPSQQEAADWINAFCR